VHKSLGPGFIEGVYQKAMEIAFRHRQIPFERQKEIHLYFEDEDLGVQRIDLLVCGEIVVELKAVERFAPIHFVQLKSYLRCLGLRVGLLVNFNAATLQVKLMVL